MEQGEKGNKAKESCQLDPIFFHPTYSFFSALLEKEDDLIWTLSKSQGGALEWPNVCEWVRNTMKMKDEMLHTDQIQAS